MKRQRVELVTGGVALAELPLPTAAAPATETLLIDFTHLGLDDEARDRLDAWIAHGGEAILIDGPAGWPARLEASLSEQSTTKVRVREPLDDDDDEATIGRSIFEGELAHGRSVDIKHADVPIATLGDAAFALTADVGEGRVLAIANDDLFTNAGLMRPGNAAVLTAILERFDVKRLRIVRAEDAATPAGDPLTALVHAGLGPSLAQAAFATVLLFAAFGIAAGRRRGVREVSRRAFSEHVSAVGALYARAKLGRHALVAYVRFADARVRDRSTFAGEEPAVLLSRRSERPLDECREIWRRAHDVVAESETEAAPSSKRTNARRAHDHVRALRALARLLHDARLTDDTARGR